MADRAWRNQAVGSDMRHPVGPTGPRDPPPATFRPPRAIFGRQKGSLRVPRRPTGPLSNTIRPHSPTWNWV